MRDTGRSAAATAGARVEFLPGQGDDPTTVENIDSRIYRSVGVCHHATFMTTDEIARVLMRWNGSGEFGGGRYFWCSDLVIVPPPGVQTMVATVDELIRSGDIDAVLGKVQDMENGATQLSDWLGDDQCRRGWTSVDVEGPSSQVKAANRGVCPGQPLLVAEVAGYRQLDCA